MNPIILIKCVLFLMIMVCYSNASSAEKNKYGLTKKLSKQLEMQIEKSGFGEPSSIYYGIVYTQDHFNPATTDTNLKRLFIEYNDSRYSYVRTLVWKNIKMDEETSADILAIIFISENEIKWAAQSRIVRIRK